MIKIFEGARNSGKTFLSSEFSKISNLPLFKFQFSDWFGLLNLTDQDPKTHYFALGKELMLLQVNKERLLSDLILDRGFLTVFTWAILSGRTTEENAMTQFDLLQTMGLLTNLQIFVVVGKNPSKNARIKDHWDFRDGQDDEARILSKLIAHLQDIAPQIPVIEIKNDFTSNTLSSLRKFL
ncbi:hypothetical protein EBS02_04905 [bacterium]|nr:hypothetical protein [bacterium]